MNRPTATAALFLILGAAATSGAAAPASGPDRYATHEALVWVEGTSTVHDWRVEGTAIEGEVTVGEEFFNHAAAPDALPAGYVSIPARSLESGKGRMDALMYEALAADEHPTIDFRLTGATMDEPSPASPVTTASVTGRLTIAGTTREISLSLQVDRSTPGTLILSGQLPLAMTDFGIDPPRAMLGTLKTGDKITVGFRWAVTANGP